MHIKRVTILFKFDWSTVLQRIMTCFNLQVHKLTKQARGHIGFNILHKFPFSKSSTYLTHEKAELLSSSSYSKIKGGWDSMVEYADTPLILERKTRPLLGFKRLPSNYRKFLWQSDQCARMKYHGVFPVIGAGEKTILCLKVISHWTLVHTFKYIVRHQTR